MSTRWSLESHELRALRPCYAPARRGNSRRMDERARCAHFQRSDCWSAGASYCQAPSDPALKRAGARGGWRVRARAGRKKDNSQNRENRKNRQGADDFRRHASSSLVERSLDGVREQVSPGDRGVNIAATRGQPDQQARSAWVAAKRVRSHEEGSERGCYPSLKLVRCVRNHLVQRNHDSGGHRIAVVKRIVLNCHQPSVKSNQAEDAEDFSQVSPQSLERRRQPLLNADWIAQAVALKDEEVVRSQHHCHQSGVRVKEQVNRVADDLDLVRVKSIVQREERFERVAAIVARLAREKAAARFSRTRGVQLRFESLLRGYLFRVADEIVRIPRIHEGTVTKRDRVSGSQITTLRFGGLLRDLR